MAEGMTGSAELGAKPKRSAQDRRNHQRTKVSWRARLMTSRGSFDCRVLNISPGGALVRLIASIDELEAVTLHFADSERIDGVVVWHQNPYIGICFTQPFERDGISDTASADTFAREADDLEAVGTSAETQAIVETPIAVAPRGEPQPFFYEEPKPAASTHDPVVRLPGTRLDKGRVSALAGQIQAAVMDRIDAEQATRLSRESLAKQLEPMVKEIIAEQSLQLNTPERSSLIRQLVDDMVGFGPLEPLLEDETISDILVDGPKRVYVERRGKLEPTDVTFSDDQHVMNVATRIVTLVGRRIDESTPLMDARLPDGSRVNVIVPPLAIDGPMISIRKFTKKAITLAKMVDQGNISQPMAAVLTIATKARLNILVFLVRLWVL